MIELRLFLLVEIDDYAVTDSDRADIERNAIALVSNINGCPDIPSPEWMGSQYPHIDIRESEL